MNLDKHGHVVDVRDVDREYHHPYKSYTPEEIEMFKTPHKLEHFIKRIEIIRKKARNELEFLSWMKYKVINLIPFIDKNLVLNINKYLFQNFTYDTYSKIMKKCAPLFDSIIYKKGNVNGKR